MINESVKFKRRLIIASVIVALYGIIAWIYQPPQLSDSQSVSQIVQNGHTGISDSFVGFFSSFGLIFLSIMIALIFFGERLKFLFSRWGSIDNRSAAERELDRLVSEGTYHSTGSSKPNVKSNQEQQTLIRGVDKEHL